MKTRDSTNLVAIAAVGFFIICGWNLWAANRDAQGMKCYAQTASVECPSDR
jgi:hypothetical protein